MDDIPVRARDNEHMSGPNDTAVWQDARPARAQVVFDVVTAAGFGLFALLAQLTQGGFTLVAAALLVLALAIRRWWLPGMVVLAFAAAVGQLADREIAFIADIAYFPLFFTLGASQRRGVRRFGLAAGVVATVVAGVAMALNAQLSSEWYSSPTETAFAAVSTAAMCAVFTLGGWLVGYLRWQGRQTVQARVDAALEARVNAVEQQRLAEVLRQEAERSRIAADMHDVVAHSWAVVAAQADGARYGLRSHPEEAEGALRTIGETARTAMADVRRLLTQLRDRETDPVPLDFERRGELLGRMRASGMTIVETSYGTPPEHRLLTVTAHRILGEALTNALKHGDLTRPVEVAEDWTHGYRLRVRNAIPPGASRDGRNGEPGGHGLAGMAERAEVAGGTFANRTLPAEPGRPSTWEVAAFIPTTEDR